MNGEKKIVKKKGKDRIVIIDEKVENSLPITLREDDIRIDWSRVRPYDMVRVLSTGEVVRILRLPDIKGFVEIEPVEGGEVRRVYMRELTKFTTPIRKVVEPVKEEIERNEKKIKNGEEGAKSVQKRGRIEKRSRNDLKMLPLQKDMLIDLRGLKVDEAIFEMEKKIREFYEEKREFLFIIHGKGTGALKNAVRRALKRLKDIEEWAPGSRKQGGDGVTIVRIKVG